MPAIPVTSDSAILQRFAELADVKLNATLRKSIDAHRRLVEEVVPEASADRAVEEANMDVARRTGLAARIENAYKTIADGGDRKDIKGGPNPLVAAQAALDAALLEEVILKHALKTAATFVGVCAREPAAKMPAKMDQAWSKVVVTLNPQTTTMAEAAAAEGLGEILARVLFQVAVIVEEVPTGPIRRELKAEYDNRPTERPRLRDIEDRLNTQDAARRAKESAVQAKAAVVRAQMSGDAVSTGRMDLTDAERESTRTAARQRSGHVEEVVETDGIEVAV